MSLSRGTPAPAPMLSPEARAALAWLLYGSNSDDLLVKAIRAAVRVEHGIGAYQELRAAAAGLAVKPLAHEVAPHDPGTFRVQSRSAKAQNEEPETYVVDLEEWTCGCKSYEVRKHCSHIDSAVAFTLL